MIVAGHPDRQQPGLHGPEHRRLSELGLHAAIAVIAVIVAVVVAGFIYIRRDLAGLWVAIAGVVTGIVAAIVSAPIAAIVFGGVTGSGTDLIVAALRQGGADVLQASLGQGLISATRSTRRSRASSSSSSCPACRRATSRASRSATGYRRPTPACDAAGRSRHERTGLIATRRLPSRAGRRPGIRQSRPPAAPTSA